MGRCMSALEGFATTTSPGALAFAIYGICRTGVLHVLPGWKQGQSMRSDVNREIGLRNDYGGPRAKG